MDIKAIAVTGAAYLILLILFIKTGKKRTKSWEKRRKIRKGICFFFFVNTLSVAVFIWTGQERPVKDGKLGRDEKGGGSRNETVLATVDGICERVPVQIRVDEQGYIEEEATAILKEVSEELEAKILGSNEKRSYVTMDLDLITSIPGYPVSIQWTLDNYDHMGLDGTLREGIPEEGVTVHLRAVLSFEYGQKQMAQKTWETTVTLYPPDLQNPEQVIEALEHLGKEETEKSRDETALSLPDEIAGHAVTWGRDTAISGYQVLGMGGLIFLLLAAWGRQKASEAIKIRKNRLLQDYPEILEQFSLLIGAGMTVKSAWYKIVDNYQERKDRCGKRPAYEEMVRTCFEMQGGVPEGESYENFGKRCQTQEYMRLGLLLSQNQRKGTRGITELLSLEAIHAFEDRKARAKRKGEETGTKLLVPMIMMLAVVLVIVIVPAFWSTGI